MSTAGFDFVAEINETLVNRALAAAFYTTAIPHTIAGDYTPSGVEIPTELRPYAEVEYEIRLKEPPTVDAFTGNVVRILFNVESVLKVLGGLRLEFDVVASVEASPTYDQTARVLTINLKTARIDKLDINDKYGLSKEVLSRLNSVIAAAIRSGVLEKVEKISVATIASVDLPDMPPGPSNKLKIGLGNIKILNRSVLAVCLNFLEYVGGDIARLTDFSGGLDFCGEVSEAAMHRVFDFWWDRTTHPKNVNISDRYTVPGLDTAAEVALALSTLGLSLAIVDLNSWIEYDVTVRFGKPNFNLKSGNKIEANCDLHLDARAEVKVEIRNKVTGDRHTRSLGSLSISNQHVVVDKILAEVFLDDQNRLMGKIVEVDVEIDLPRRIPEVALNWLIDQIEALIKNRIPPFPLSPALITREIPGTALTLQVDIDRLATDEDEAIVGTTLAFKEIGRTAIPVPKFIANKDPLAREVHRADCQQVEKIWEKNKVGYYVLLDALKDGYDGCKYCLPEYHRR